MGSSPKEQNKSHGNVKHSIWSVRFTNLYKIYSIIFGFYWKYFIKLSVFPTTTFWDVTSCLKAFLKPVRLDGAKARPGTQLTTTGSPLSQVPLDLSDSTWPSLQLDRWASFPVQLTE